jgi:DNA-binding transcriptional LysR family regulator
MLKQVHATDLHLLRVFIAVAEERGIAAAQYRLNVAPSTISTQILNLEERLGLKLCVRGRGGFALTDEGRIVLESAYTLQQGLDDFSGTIGTLKGQVVGNVRIAVIDNLLFQPELRLSQALRQLRQKYPNISFELSTSPPNKVEEDLLSQKIDMGVTWVINAIPSLSRHKLLDERQVVFCGKDHSMFDMPDDQITEKELEQSDWVSRSYPMPRSFPFSHPHNSTAVAWSMETVAHAVLSGAYLGFLPTHYAEHWVRRGELRPILPDQFTYDVPHYLAARNDMLQSPLIKICRDEILNVHSEGRIDRVRKLHRSTDDRS